jgi:type II secretory pathway pseudopilin PulG
VEIMIVVAIIGIIVAIAVPGFINARAQSRAKACQEAQEKLDGATQEWALENNKAGGDTPAWADLVGADLYLNRTPICPEDGSEIALHTANAMGVCPNTLATHARN